ncbi:MAG: WYL domain-containing protein [Armatimonadota bacterium]|nr:WYL domain-containing protein [Armatimonadota bacterium]
MSKSVLLLQALELLRAKQGVTISELATELNRSERTIYRYLADLSYELQVPVYCEDGVYRLAVRNDASGIFNLTPDEALAVHVALTSTAFAASSPFESAAQSALRKIESTIRNPSFEQVKEDAPRHTVAPSVFSKHIVDDETSSLIRDALRNKKRLKITYRSQKSAKVEILVVEPYGIAFRRHNWYVVAHSAKHGRAIQLKMARILDAEETGETFDTPSDFSIKEFYDKSWEVWTGGEETEVRVRFSKRVAPMIRENHYHPTQLLQDTGDGGVIFSVAVAGIEEIGAWILGYGADAEALAPRELRDRIRCALTEMLSYYERDFEMGETDHEFLPSSLEDLSESISDLQRDTSSSDEANS